jgi:hypothetical protein
MMEKTSTCKNPKCAKLFIVKKWSKGIFCSNSCAATFNNTCRVRTKESKAKVSIKIKKLIAEGKAKPPPQFSQKGRSWRKSPNSSWLEYKKSCAFYTPLYILEKIENLHLINEIGWYDPNTNPTGVSRDHMFSVSDGWKNNIPAEIIRHPANCMLMPILENKRKGKRSSITYEELLQKIEKWRSR